MRALRVCMVSTISSRCQMVMPDLLCAQCLGNDAMDFAAGLQRGIATIAHHPTAPRHRQHHAATRSRYPSRVRQPHRQDHCRDWSRRRPNDFHEPEPAKYGPGNSGPYGRKIVVFLVRGVHTVIVEPETDEERVDAERALEIAADGDRAAAADRDDASAPLLGQCLARLLSSTAESCGTASAGEPEWLMNSAVTSSGRRSRTN